MLLEFVLFVTPGSGLMFFIFRFIRANAQVGIARTDTARAQARLEGAQQASAVAEETAREALAQTGQALEIARTLAGLGSPARYDRSYQPTQEQCMTGIRCGRQDSATLLA